MNSTDFIMIGRDESGTLVQNGIDETGRGRDGRTSLSGM
jgi:hypothetical protein